MGRKGIGGREAKVQGRRSEGAGESEGLQRDLAQSLKVALPECGGRKVGH